MPIAIDDLRAPALRRHRHRAAGAAVEPAIRCAATSRPMHLRSASASSRRRSASFVAAIEVEAAGRRRAARSSPTLPLTGDRRAARLRTQRPASSRGGAWHEAPVYCREALLPGHDASPARRSSSSRTRPSSSSPAGSSTVTARQRPRPDARRRPRQRERLGADGRPDAARGVQQPVHVDRRADGRGAAQHRAVGQHQGAARFLLRRVRRDRRARRQRAAHAGAPRLAWTARSRRSSASAGRACARATSTC